MTFSYVIKNLKDAQAAKTSSMAGYVYRTDVPKGPGDEFNSKYTLTFRERPGDADTNGSSEYVFTFIYDKDGKLGVTAPEKPLVVDAQLLQLLASEDWSVVDKESAEAALTGGTRW